MHKQKLTLWAVAVAMGVNSVTLAYAEESLSYVDGTTLFIETKDVNRQAEKWATCAAAYDIFSEFLASDSSRAQMVKNLANGAEVAVMMAIVMDELKPDITNERFSALWTFAQMQSTELPKTQRTMMLADAEVMGEDRAVDFLAKITTTVEVCSANLGSQQMYVDSWRELAKSGLLTLPHD